VIRERPTVVVLSLFLLASPAAWLRTSNLGRAVERSLRGRPGSAVVLDVVSDRVLPAQRLDLAGAQLVRPGLSLKPFVLMEPLLSGKRGLFVGYAPGDLPEVAIVAGLPGGRRFDAAVLEEQLPERKPR